MWSGVQTWRVLGPGAKFFDQFDTFFVGEDSSFVEERVGNSGREEEEDEVNFEG